MATAAGNQPPEGYDPSELGYLQSALQGDLYAQAAYNHVVSTEYYSPSTADTGTYDGSPQAPARLTDIPTSSINASRPRTVAAGYDANRKVLTVMFRDGTLINYYDVEIGTWQNFQGSVSKGRPWLNFYGPGTPGELVRNHQYGPADTSSVDPSTLADIYRIARSAQVRFTTRSGTVNRNSSNGRGRYAYKPGKNPAARMGQNPATSNRRSRKP